MDWIQKSFGEKSPPYLFCAFCRGLLTENSIFLQLDARELHDLHSHPDIRKARKAPDIYNISLQSTFFIGMDTTKHKPVVTDRNPNLEGLVDIHQCVYLPSAYEKQSFNLPDNLPQVRIFYVLLLFTTYLKIGSDFLLRILDFHKV